MDIITKIKGLSYLGFRTILQSIAYSIFRYRMDRRFLKKPDKKRDSPGHLLETDRIENGILFKFEKAELEIKFLLKDMVRITWQPGILPVPYAIARNKWQEIKVECKESENQFLVSSSDIQISVSETGSLIFLHGNNVLREDLPPERIDEKWMLKSLLKPDEHFFGLGLRSSSFDLKGGTYRMWNRDPGGAYGPNNDPLYLAVPVYAGIHEKGSYLVFHENSFDGSISFKDIVTAQFENGALRYYFIPGSPEHAVENYTELTGRPPLPPRWALGFHQSRWSYMNEKEVMEVAEGFEKHRLPVSSIHLDIHYMDGHRVFTLDKNRFPDLKCVSGKLEEKGIRLVAIIDPGVKKDPEYDIYKQGHEKGLFCVLPDQREIAAPVWPGLAAFPDFTDPAAREWWGSLYPLLLDNGIAGIWHDMNEPSAFDLAGDLTLPRSTCHKMEGRGGDHREAHNLYALLEACAGFEGMKKHNPERRPWILSRSGWAGIQRYAWNWTGDSESNWWTMKQSLRIAISLGLAGIPYTGPDTGGFGGKPTTGMFLRWFEFSSFLPFFRIHSAFFTGRREPWCFGEEAVKIIRKYLELRYSLLPYWYTCAWKTSRKGHPIVKPLFFHDCKSPDLMDIDDEFLLGDAFLIAPVFSPDTTSLSVLIPDGIWYSLWDDRKIKGHARVNIETPVDRMPVMVRAGSIIPMERKGRLELHIYAPSISGRGYGELYSDAGDGYGGFRVDRFKAEWIGNDLEILRESEGDFPFPYQEIDLIVHGLNVSGVSVDGKSVDFVKSSITVHDFTRILFCKS
jgi:alpha-glucosidase